MFKWLFGGSNKTEPTQAQRFDAAHKMVMERATNLKQEFERTRNNPEITENLKQYSDPAYIAGSRDAVFLTIKRPEFQSATQILPLTATMFMTMASHAFDSPSRFEDFEGWANAYSDADKRNLVRFAYLHVVWEQEQSGARHPVAFASRIILTTLAANANKDTVSQDCARELFSFIARLKKRGDRNAV